MKWGWAKLRASAGLWGALVTVLVGYAVWITPALGPWLQALSFDTLYLLAPSSPATGAVVVALDEESYHRLGQAPDRLWDRSLHARLVEAVFRRGARAIVFDMLFVDAWADPGVDERFAHALRQVPGKAVLAASARIESRAGQALAVTCLTPLEVLAGAAPWGVVEVPMDPDRALRRHWSLSQYPSLSWKTVEVLGHAPEDPGRARWIHYYGPPGTVRTVSYWQGLEAAALPAGYFSNQVVLVGKGSVIGPEGAHPSDEYATPHTRWTGRQITGVELQATLFLNLWRRDWLEEWPVAVEALLFGIGGAAVGLGLAQLRPRRALAAALVIAAITGGLAWAMAWGLGRWFPWLILGGVQVPCALGWSVLSFVQRAAQRRDIPDHTLLRCIGRGGYGEVWLARDVLGGYHAVKIVERQRFSRSDPFEREFRGVEHFAPLSRSHPGLVHILHVGRNELRGSFYYIMELADDQESGLVVDPTRYSPRTLASDIARRGRLPAAACVDLGIALAGALEHLHQQGLVHRDLKPANIVFVGGRPKLADAGLVTRVTPAGTTASRVGTAGYLAPEGPGTARADVYSLGKVLYEVATGCSHERFPELPSDLGSTSDADLLLRLHQLILTACETDPGDRFPSASALEVELRRLLSPPAPSSPPMP